MGLSITYPLIKAMNLKYNKTIHDYFLYQELNVLNPVTYIFFNITQWLKVTWQFAR